jgi:hypothetical protein
VLAGHELPRGRLTLDQLDPQPLAVDHKAVLAALKHCPHLLYIDRCIG